jgi:phospholipase C
LKRIKHIIVPMLDNRSFDNLSGRLTRDYRPVFRRWPERTGVFRALTAHRAWTDYFGRTH